MSAASRHLHVLEERHRRLDDQVDHAQQGRAVDPAHISWLKRKRLALRDLIEHLRGIRRVGA